MSNTVSRYRTTAAVTLTTMYLVVLVGVAIMLRAFGPGFAPIAPMFLVAVTILALLASAVIVFALRAKMAPRPDRSSTSRT